MEKRLIKTKCNKCGTDVTLDFENLSFDEAFEQIKKIDVRSMECPGFHVDFGGWKKRWNLVKALEEAYSEEEKKFSLLPYTTDIYINSKKVKTFIGIESDIEAEQYLHELRFDEDKEESIKVYIQEKTRSGKVIFHEVIEM